MLSELKRIVEQNAEQFNDGHKLSFSQVIKNGADLLPVKESRRIALVEASKYNSDIACGLAATWLQNHGVEQLPKIHYEELFNKIMEFSQNFDSPSNDRPPSSSPIRVRQSLEWGDYEQTIIDSDEIQKENKQIESKISDQAGEIKKLREELDSKQQQINSQRLKIQSLQQAALESVVEGAGARRNENIFQGSSIPAPPADTNQVRVYEDKFQQQEDLITQLKERIKEMSQEVAQKKSEFGQKQEEVVRLNGELKKYSTTVKDLRKELKKNEAQLKKSREAEELSRNILRDEIAELQHQIFQTRTANVSMEFVTPRLSIGLEPETLDIEVTEKWKRRCAEAEEENAETKKQLEQAERQVDELENLIRTLKETELKTEIKYTAILAAENQKKVSLEDALQNAQKIAKEVDEMYSKKIQKLEVEGNAAKAAAHRLETETTRLKTQITEMVPREEYESVVESEKKALQEISNAKFRLEQLAVEAKNAKQEALLQKEAIRAMEEDAKIQKMNTKQDALFKMEINYDRNEDRLNEAMANVARLEEMMRQSRQATTTAETNAHRAREKVVALHQQIASLEQQLESCKASLVRETAVKKAETMEKNRISLDLQRLQKHLDSLTLKRANESDEVLRRQGSLAALQLELSKGKAAMESAAAVAAERESALKSIVSSLKAAAREDSGINMGESTTGSEAMQRVIARFNKDRQITRQLTENLTKQLTESETECARLRKLLNDKQSVLIEQADVISKSLTDVQENAVDQIKNDLFNDQQTRMRIGQIPLPPAKDTSPLEISKDHSTTTERTTTGDSIDSSKFSLKSLFDVGTSLFTANKRSDENCATNKYFDLHDTTGEMKNTPNINASASSSSYASTPSNSDGPSSRLTNQRSQSSIRAKGDEQPAKPESAIPSNLRRKKKTNGVLF